MILSQNNFPLTFIKNERYEIPEKEEIPNKKLEKEKRFKEEKSLSVTA